MPNAHAHGQRPSYPGETPQGFSSNGVHEDPLDRTEKGQLEHVLESLYRGRWIVLVTLLIVFGVVAFYTYSLPEIYRAQGLVLVSKETDTRRQQFALGPRQPLALNNQSLANELLILRNSMDLARDVARRLQGMERVPETGAPLTVAAGGAADSLALERLAHRVQSRVSFARVDQETDAIVVAATSTVPSEAALLANLYMEEYLQLTRDASRTSLSAKREFLEDQEYERQQELQAAENALQEYMRREGAMALDQEQTNLVSQIGNLEAQRDAINLELQTKQEQLRNMEQRLEQVDANIARRIGSTVDEDLRNAQQRLAQRQAEKEQILFVNPNLSPESDSLREVNREITELKQRVQRLSNEYVAEVRAAGTASVQGSGEGEGSAQGLGGLISLENQIAQQRIEISGLEARLRVLEDRLQEYRGDLNQIPEQSMELAQLQRQRRYTERMHQMVTEALQTTRIEEQSEVGYADIIREAFIPGSPVSPNTMRNLLAGFFGGLFLGIGLALTRNVLDKRLFTPEDLHNLGENVIGVVPDMRAMIKSEFGGADYIKQDERRFATSLVALLNPMSAAAESYRHLRTNIQFSFPDMVVETILVTSPNKGEGKSVTAANLAIVMAQAGRRTLLVDADLRRPRVHRLFDLNREPGLVSYLFAETEVDLGDLDTMATGIDNLYTCPAGKSVPNPAELLGSERMRAFAAAAREQFDLVIFDTPPVLTATDAPLLSTLCDATIVVTQAGSTKTYELDQTMKSLSGVSARVVGTLLNGFDISMTYGYDYKYRYYAQDYYGDDQEESTFNRRRLMSFLRR